MLKLKGDKRLNRYTLWVATALLLLSYGLAMGSMSQKSPTFDEQGFIVRGLGYLRGENQQMRVGHPLGINALNAAFLVNDASVKLPVDDPSWTETGFHRPAELFLWEIGNDVGRIMFLARLPSLWLGMLLAAVVGRWAWLLSRRRWAGVLALLLIAFDPNILASTRLATTDLGLALGVTVAGFLLWRYWKRPSWQSLILAGIGLGLMLNTKFTVGLFIPLFALVSLLGMLINPTPQPPSPPTPTLAHSILKFILFYPLIGFFTLWALYGFQMGTLPAQLPMLTQLGGATMPLSHYVEQLLDIGGRLQVATPSFLLGNYSDTGWWFYFPVAFLLKTPLPTLLLLLLAVVLRGVWYVRGLGMATPCPYRGGLRAAFFDDAALLVPALGYFAFALTSEINLGYRHLLPMLPFLAVFTANSLAQIQILYADRKSRLTQRLFPAFVGGMAGLLMFIILWMYPHYLAYFNLLAGGPQNGWRALVDSNLDWGQDLGALSGWMVENGVEEVWLSYFGEARPEYYGIKYQGLDSWPPRLWNPQIRPYSPSNPAPGIYAISATNLQGVQFANRDQFAWFREREPIAKIGYSIFLYEVLPMGEPVELALGGVQLDEIAPEDLAQLGTNQLILHWFDPTQSMLIPIGPKGKRILVFQKEDLESIDFISTTSFYLLGVSEDYLIYSIPTREFSILPDSDAIFRNGDDGIWLFSGFARNIEVTAESINLQTTWIQQSNPSPVKMFVHLLDEQGNLVAQWDGLGVAWQGWRMGDILFQDHQLPLPADMVDGSYQLVVGLYNPQTGQRWRTEDGADSFLLKSIMIGEE